MQFVFSFIDQAWLPALIFLLVAGAGWLVHWLSYHTIRRYSPTHAPYASAALLGAVIVGGGYAGAVTLGVNPTILLALLAILTAGISLAADQTMANAIAGAVILANRWFFVGDQVTIGGTSGTVKEIGFTSVVLHVNTRGLVTFPSSAIVGSELTNHTRADYVELPIALPMYDNHDRKGATALIKATIKDLGYDHKVLYEWGAGGEGYTALIRVREYGKRREILSDLAIILTDELLKAGYPLGIVTFYREVKE